MTVYAQVYSFGISAQTPPVLNVGCNCGFIDHSGVAQNFQVQPSVVPPSILTALALNTRVRQGIADYVNANFDEATIYFDNVVLFGGVTSV